MKKVLMISDRFPDTGGSRTEKFVKYLPRYGYQPVVLTKKSITKENTSLIDKDYPHLNLIKTLYIPSPFRILSKIGYRKIALAIEKYLFIPDISVTWLPFAILSGFIRIKKDNIKLIYSTSPYESNHLISFALKMLTNVKWVADFRDLWSLKRVKGANEAPTLLHQKIIKYLEYKIMNKADAIIANTEYNAKIYKENFGIKKDKITVIPNGYDLDDIPKEEQTPFSTEKGRKFIIGYNGYFGDPFPWGVFFKVLEKCAFLDNVVIRVCGYLSDEVKDYISNSKLKNCFEYNGIVSHLKSLEIVNSTDVLLALLYETSFSDAIIPMKVYNYIALGKPIIALAGENGSMAELLRLSKTGFTYSVGNSGQFKNKLEELYYEWEINGKIEMKPDVRIINNYDRKILTEKLCSVFRNIL